MIKKNNKDELDELRKWIKANLKKRVKINRMANSYYLKHLFEYETGIYVDEETFIKVMDILGYEYDESIIGGKRSRDYKIRKTKSSEYYIAKGELRKASEAGWVMTSEKLPTYSGCYLCTVWGGDIKMMKFSCKDNSFINLSNSEKNDLVDAWMPLPKPFPDVDGLRMRGAI